MFLAAGSTPASDEHPEVKIEIFSDFECSYCKTFAPAAREIESKGIEGVKTRVAFRNFPLRLSSKCAACRASGDGLSDGDETLQHHTNPLNPDSDKDGYNDEEE